MERRRGRRGISVKKKSIWLRYFTTVSLCIVIAVGLLSLSIMMFVSRNWETNRLDRMSENCMMISRILYGAVGADNDELTDLFEEPEDVSQICLTIKHLSESSESDVFVMDEIGSVVFCGEMALDEAGAISEKCCDYHASLAMGQDARDLISETLPAVAKETGDLFGMFDSDHFVSSYPIWFNGKTVGYIVSAQEVSVGLRPYLVNFFKMLLISTGIALFASVIIVYFSTYNMVKPMKEMVEAAGRYSKGDFSYKIEDDSDILEIYELKKAINQMADDLALIENSRASFVANVSHELKTPMTTIGGFIDGMLDGTIPKDQYDKYLTIVSDEVKRLSRLVISMLNMSKIEAGQLKLSPSRFDIGQNIFKTLIGFEQSIAEKKITIEGLESFDKCTINADASLMTQVFYNLIDNAIKFTDPGGVITFNCREGEDDTVVISIGNTGSGIPENDLNRIFERFYKVDKSRGLDTKSFGLGLYIVKSIVEFHGGTIEARSVPEKYTEFTLVMPKGGKDNE